MLLQDKIPDRLPSLKKERKKSSSESRREGTKTQIRPENCVGEEEAICIFFNKRKIFLPFSKLYLHDGKSRPD